MNAIFPEQPVDPRAAQITKLAVMAVGGQGGGVLTGWIEALARAQGYAVQATSVAGVAQRTGATIYYVEMTPKTDHQPIFALAPSAGDVDILIAAEMMEVGRAVMRGFVTPDRTVLIGSSHRALAVSEKTVPGDGIADAEEVRAAAEIAAQTLILADMEQLAVGQGSVISASLFGALAGVDALPFPRAAFEDAIRQSGKAVDASLRAFDAGFDAAQNGDADTVHTPDTPREITGPQDLLREYQRLLDRIHAMPPAVQQMATAGLLKVVDFQDYAYGASYLDRVNGIIGRDSSERGWLLSITAAKYIANAMAYDDIIRVADIKTRGPRFDRIRAEMGAKPDQVMQLTEYFHPRAEEIAGLLPAKLGAWVEGRPKAMAWLDRRFGKGRRLRTDSLPAFVMLYVLGGLKSYRLKTRRHAIEVAHLEAWLDRCLAPLEEDYALCVEMLRCRRLIKGYSDTHARGLTKFDSVMNGAQMVKGRKDAADWVARLREAALQDPEGKALSGALETIRSFA
ncbi:indolepyruvate oxidoreductase subunit beta family protein [Sulfitobacter sp. CW3]|uniref:indolepyruvate oxidoreductase subunit beta family protein n=1 Tax=Sulfitobacter sp. CW3 TaxID=2861965 RepID=UPI001C5D671B|nr:indolepyruvate oxidoreductase subunit beta family protein [Sulfitobacter sp. CW3]MBW4962491.1 indolepyruvate oxidoreductase subunit beta family protein [Sulfitobacter sp. CW3]